MTEQNLPKLPEPLIDLISEYGFARSDGLSDVARLDLWQRLIVSIKDYTRAAIEQSRAWLPIESAPEDGTPILGFWGHSSGAYTRLTGNNYGITAYNVSGSSWYDASESDNEDDTWCAPSYWMPLPAAPAPDASRHPEPQGDTPNG